MGGIKMKRVLPFVASLAVCLNSAALSVCAVGDSITQGGSAFVAHRIALEREFAALDWNVEWKGTLRTRSKVLALNIIAVCDEVDTRKSRGVLVKEDFQYG